MGESRNAYRVLVGRPKGKRPLGKPRRRGGKFSLLSKNLEIRIYKTVIIPVVLYGCETWTLTLREEQRLRVFENKVLRKIFRAKRDEVTGEWRKLHNAELHALYSSPDIIRNIKSRRLRWVGHEARMGESRNAYRVLVGRPEGKKSLGRPRRRWEDNIKMDLREVEYDDIDWINIAQDRDRWRAYVRAAMNLRVPEKPFVRKYVDAITPSTSVDIDPPPPLFAVPPRSVSFPVKDGASFCDGFQGGCSDGCPACSLAGSRVAYVKVVVHTELALFTVQIGKSSAVSSVANTHGQKEIKPVALQLSPGQGSEAGSIGRTATAMSTPAGSPSHHHEASGFLIRPQPQPTTGTRKEEKL
ncbi:hypothetical protein ANN_20150 [Periplaneta americana]|uniref:Uncharacterized protein n=1 Tax=Periplaneta americana TaxID=6978 RepID=A0ABQ8SCI6_PERAM|nr:hypothetical protein ANN_20150 [Periplaneta americana]